MPNFDGLNEMRIHYTVDVGGVELPHQQTFDVKLSEVYPPGTPWAEIEVSNQVGGSTPAQTFINAYLVLVGELYNTAVNFVSVELWSIPEGTFDATFISSNSIGDPGASVAPSVAAQQCIFTFRTLAGGIMKLYFMETVISSQLKLSYPTDTASIDAIFAFVIASEQPFVGRDNTRPIAPLNFSPGQNEAVWRRRFRP